MMDSVCFARERLKVLKRIRGRISHVRLCFFIFLGILDVFVPRRIALVGYIRNRVG